MDFDRAVSIILELEGGYSMDPSDPGGETAYGISKRAHPEVDVPNLTPKEAIEIYRKSYWEPLKPILLPDVMRLPAFDCAVNQGLVRAIKTIQGAVGAKQDGILGPQTLYLLSSCDPAEALQNFMLIRLYHYQKLPHWDRFGKGWSRRLLLIALECLR